MKTEVQAEMAAILHAYNSNYDGGEDDVLVATPDDNTKIVAEYIRMRLLPAVHKASEFEATFDSTVIWPEQELADYDRDLEAIRAMTKKQRVSLDDQLLEISGRKRDRGGIMVLRSSHGDQVAGFAIDSHTLKSAETQGFGLHALAAMNLSAELDDLEDYDRETVGVILRGNIFFDVEGFKTPIVQLFLPWPVQDHSEFDPQFQRVGSHLISQRRMIPVDYDCNLVDGTFSFNGADRYEVKPLKTIKQLIK